MQSSAVVVTGAIVRHGKGCGHFGAPVSTGELLVDRVHCHHEGVKVLPRHSAFSTRHLTKKEIDLCHNICGRACGRK